MGCTNQREWIIARTKGGVRSSPHLPGRVVPCLLKDPDQSLDLAQPPLQSVSVPSLKSAPFQVIGNVQSPEGSPHQFLQVQCGISPEKGPAGRRKVIRHDEVGSLSVDAPNPLQYHENPYLCLGENDHGLTLEGDNLSLLLGVVGEADHDHVGAVVE